ncbi:unnamed protein product [Protopolystoma xenopodis]|uniref:Uncharacterized protein n=1 Tax=Protopolystoma xenopodis TaxID=117903 RepID=A0A3S5CS83_9PLAT|nr:unnamed protein product [Protopolystoma xenopodis]
MNQRSGRSPGLLASSCMPLRTNNFLESFDEMTPTVSASALSPAVTAITLTYPTQELLLRLLPPVPANGGLSWLAGLGPDDLFRSRRVDALAGNLAALTRIQHLSIAAGSASSPPPRPGLEAATRPGFLDPASLANGLPGDIYPIAGAPFNAASQQPLFSSSSVSSESPAASTSSGLGSSTDGRLELADRVQLKLKEAKIWSELYACKAEMIATNTGR